MTKTEIVLVPKMSPLPITGESALFTLPMEEQKCSYVFGGSSPVNAEGGEGVTLKVLKNCRQLVIKIKEIGIGITVIIGFVGPSGPKTISLSNDSELIIKTDVLKDDTIVFRYSYPVKLFPDPVVDFELKLVK
jgi:hypothetical protein